MKYLILIVSIFLLIGCSSTSSPSIEDNADQLRDELTILNESISVNLESDNETINVSFENDMLFEFGDYSVKPEFKDILKTLSNFLIKYPSFEISIEGHTDSIGDKYSNLTLSEQRALSVASILIDNNVSSQRINSIGYGEEKPKYDNDTEEGRSHNRRAEIKLKKYLIDNSTESVVTSESEIEIIENTDIDTDTSTIEIVEEYEDIDADTLAEEKRVAKKKKAKKRAKLKRDKAKKAKKAKERRKKQAQIKRDKQAKQRAKQERIKQEKKAKQRAKQERIKREQKAKQRAKQERIKREKEAKQRAKQEQIRREKEEAQQRARQEQIRKNNAVKEEAEQERERSSNSII